MSRYVRKKRRHRGSKNSINNHNGIHEKCGLIDILYQCRSDLLER